MEPFFLLWICVLLMLHLWLNFQAYSHMNSIANKRLGVERELLSRLIDHPIPPLGTPYWHGDKTKQP